MKRTHRKQHRDKEPTDLQRVKDENRNLRSEIKNLKKQIKRLQRTEHFHENTKLDEEADQMIIIEKYSEKTLCPSCMKGHLAEINIVGRHWFECDQCDYDTRRLKK